MFCSRCGSEITGKSKFCPSCGLDLMATTPVHAIATGVLQELDLVRESLAAEYEIIEELGRGGMAMVYRAKDRQLEREVAVKVLPFSLAFDTEFVERFQREARTAAQLEHPNIISIYRVGRSGRVIYFVMKFLRGGSLSTVLGTRKKLTPPEIRRLLLEAGSALGYAAQRGIVHRDIKPDNIMFDEFGQCVLTDFGIAKAASGQKLTGTGMSIGTPHYMSPGAGPGPGDRRPERHLQSGCGGLPVPDRDGALRRRGQLLHRLQAHHRADSDAQPGHRRRAPGLRDHQADAHEGSVRSVSDLRGADRLLPGAAHRGARSGASSSVATASPVRRPWPAPAPACRPSRAGLPPIVSQPTTPLDSPLVNRRLTPRERREVPRRVADRSVAMRTSTSSWAWLWVLLAVLGGLAGPSTTTRPAGFAPGAVGD